MDQKKANDFKTMLAATTLVVLPFLARAESLSAPDGTEAAEKITAKKSYVPPTNELFKKLSPATAKVVVKLHGVPISTGSGFFINRSGLLITSHHVVRPLLSSPAFTGEVVLHDKRVIREFKIGACGDSRGVDLCALKLDVEPKNHFSIVKGSVSEDEPASIIGHQRNMDFSISRGEFVKYSTSDNGLSQIEIRGTVGPGNAGGPIFNDQGKLIGVVGKYRPDRPDINIGVAPSELSYFIQSESEAKSLTETRQGALEKARAEARRNGVKELDAALAFAVKSKPVEGMKGIKEVSFKFDNRLLKLSVPTIFDNCGFTQKTSDSIVHGCFTPGEKAAFSIQRFSSKGHENLLAKHGKKLMEPKALQVVDNLIQENEWEMHEELLTPEQKRSFYSSPQPAHCQRTRRNTIANAAFSDVVACRFVVSNDSDPGSQSVNIWLLKDQYLYAVTVWMNDATMSDYFWRVPILAILTAGWDKAAETPVSPRALASDQVAKPQPTFAIELPEPLGFMSTKIEPGGTQLDLYGKKYLLGRFEEGYLLAVTNQKKLYLPPDFDGATKKTASKISHALGASLQTSTIEVEPISIGNQAGRLLTAFGKDKKGKEVLVLVGAVFYDDQAFQLTQVSSAKDPAGSFKEFRKLLLGFKRK